MLLMLLMLAMLVVRAGSAGGVGGAGNVGKAGNAGASVQEMLVMRRILIQQFVLPVNDGVSPWCLCLCKVLCNLPPTIRSSPCAFSQL